MQLNTLTKRLNKHKLGLAAMALLGAVVAMGATLLMQLEYKTTSRYIVIQEQRFSDAFTQAKSAEYVSGILSRIVDTDSFRQAVFDKYGYVRGYFPESTEKLRESWSEDVTVTPFKDTGILSIAVYSADRQSGEAIVFAVGDTLTNNIKTYLGKGAAIEMKPIDGPFTTDYPARPSFGNNALAGTVLGLLFALLTFGWREPRASRATAPLPTPAKPVRKVRVQPPVPPVPASYRKLANRSNGQVQFSRDEFERWVKRAPVKA